MFFAQVRKADNVVVGVQQATSTVADTADNEYVNIDSAQYSEISSKGFFFSGSGDGSDPPHIWEQTTPGVITEQVDTRPVLVITVDDLTPTTTQEITISVQAKDYQGNDLDLTTSRKVSIYLNGGLWKVKNLPVVNGVNIFQRTLSDSGTYLILPYGSGFRTAGDIQFTVIEDF